MTADQLRRASLAKRWLFALKPAAWPKMAFPAFLGLGLAAAAGTRPSAASLLLATLWTAAMTATIVTLNDWADEEVDRGRRRLLGERCGPRTLVDGILTPRMLLAGGTLAATLVLALGALVSYGTGRLAPTWLALASLACFGAYSLPPVRLNQRGGGELLEAVGVGALLPLTIAALTGPLPSLAAVSVHLAVACELALASAILSGLSDEASDRSGGKVTFVTLFGPRVALLACGVLAGAVALTLAVGVCLHRVPWTVATIAGALLLGLQGTPWRQAATSMNLVPQGQLKRRVHRVIAGCFLTLGAHLLQA